MSNNSEIIVADDDKTVRTVIVRALNRQGFSVGGVTSAASMWDVITSGKGRLLITDICFPDGDALDLLPKLREKRPDLRFQPIPTLDDLIIEFLKKYDVDVKPITSKLKNIRDSMIGGAVTGMAGIDAGGDVFIASGQDKQTKVQEWTQWKQWALDHNDFEAFKSKRLEENQFFNKSILEKINSSPLKEELENIFKRSAFFDMSDDLFYRLSLIGFLVIFSSMVFFLMQYREKKENTISQISKTEEIKSLEF